MVASPGTAPATPSVEIYTLEYTPEGAAAGTLPTSITLTIPSVDNDPNVLNFEESVELQRVLAEQLAVPGSTIDLSRGTARLFTQDKMTEIPLAPQGAHEAAIFSNDSAAAQAATQAMGASTALADWRNVNEWGDTILDTFINTPLDFEASIEGLAYQIKRSSGDSNAEIILLALAEVEDEARRSKKRVAEMQGLIAQLKGGGNIKQITQRMVDLSGVSRTENKAFLTKVLAKVQPQLVHESRRVGNAIAAINPKSPSANRRTERLNLEKDVYDRALTYITTSALRAFEGEVEDARTQSSSLDRQTLKPDSDTTFTA